MEHLVSSFEIKATENILLDICVYFHFFLYFLMYELNQPFYQISDHVAAKDSTRIMYTAGLSAGS